MRFRTILVAILLLLIIPGVAYGLVQGEPEIRVLAPENTLTPGEETVLDLQIMNDPTIQTGSGSAGAIERVTTARGVRVSLDSGTAPIDVKTDTVGIGSLPEGQRDVAFRIVVADDAEPGTYRLPVEVRYRYTNLISETSGIHQELTRTERTHVTVVIEEGSRFRIIDTETDVGVGGSGTLSVTMENVGEEDATDVSVIAEPRSEQVGIGGGVGESFIGNWSAGEAHVLEYDVTVNPSGTARTYGFDATVSYIDSDGVERTDRPRSAGFTPAPKPTFDLIDVESTSQIGERGTATLTLEHVGDRPIEGASLRLESESETIAIDGAAAGESYIGTWNPGETRTVEYDVTVAPESTDRSYSLLATVRYDGGSGTRVESDHLSIGITPMAEQTFSIDNLDSSLRVGATGSVSGEIVNDGPTSVRNAVVQFPHEGQNVFPREREYAVGTIEPGEAVPFTFRIEIGREAEAVSRQFPIHVAYRTSTNDLRVYEDLDMPIELQERRDEFLIEATETSLAAGSNRIIELTVTNNRDEPVENVRAKLFTTSPLASDDDESFIQRLDPGDSTTLQFSLDADSDATPKTYSVSLDFRYDDERGDSKLSETYLVPIAVEPAERSLLTLPVILLGLGLIVAVGVAIWWRRTQ